jgi:hypothetical protein
MSDDVLGNKASVEEPVKGFKVAVLHWSADEEKDEKWADGVRRELPTEDWLREYELTPTGRDKDHPVFSDWKRDLHERKLHYNPRNPIIIRGWDFGKVHPAVVWVQVDGPNINVLHELMGTEVQLEQFAFEVIARSQSWFSGAVKFVDWVDPHGRAEKDDGRASIKVLKDCGIFPKFRDVEKEQGILLVAKQLIRLVQGGRPALCVDSGNCPNLCDAMRGGYKRNKNEKVIPDGFYEHLADALRYAVIGIIKASGGEIDKHIKAAKQFKYQPRNPFTGY